ncbi:MAG: selenide, water dikinase SelD [Actinomycetota bacterium]
MTQVLRHTHNHPATLHPDLLIGIEGSDDAGVYRIDDDRVIVQTVDFFTPIVDDPYEWGRIAAANALSDVYAMGADPLTALQLVSWPRDTIPFDVLGRVIEGGLEVMNDAGCTVVGGHSVDDQEPKYGFSITGTAPAEDITTNSAAKPGQVLILTKPLGTGIISTAAKNGTATDEVVQAAVESMVQTNARAAAALRRVGAKAVTDVTGFGLLGHLSEMTKGSDVSAEIDADAVPILDGALALATSGELPGGTRRNLAAIEPFTVFTGVSEALKWALADAQTSGGLLVSVDAPLQDAALQALTDNGVRGWLIGRVVERTFEHGPTGQISVNGRNVPESA